MMHALRTPAALFAAALLAGSAGAQLPVEAHRNQAELLPSADAHLAANKRLVFDFWREVVDAFLQAGTGLIAAHQAGMIWRVDHSAGGGVADRCSSASCDASSSANVLAAKPPPKKIPLSTVTMTCVRMATLPFEMSKSKWQTIGLRKLP